MDDDNHPTEAVELLSDGDGLAVIGTPAAVDSWLRSAGLTEMSRDLPLTRLAPTLATGAAAAEAASTVAASSGRWMKLTKESAELVKTQGLRTNSSGLSTGVLKKNGGTQIGGFVEFVKGPGTMLTNPAVLAGAAGLMAQLAMQQAMEEITDYLVVIDAKVDEVLRAQTDAVLADMGGAGLVIDEAMTIREHVGRVSEVTWSKVQAISATIASTQAYALRQLDAIAAKLESERGMGDLVKASRAAEATTCEWLAVLARCFQLQDAVAILELERVLDTSPAELDHHRRALQVARQNRLDQFTRSTAELLDRLNAAAGTANAKVLLHPGAAKTVVDAGNQVAASVLDFHSVLGIEHAGQSWAARGWLKAVSDVRDVVWDTGAGGVSTARRFGADTLTKARSVNGRLPQGLPGTMVRRRKPDSNG